MKRRKKRLRVIGAVDVEDTPVDILDPKIRFTQIVRGLITFASAILVVIFAWIQFSKLPFGILANSTTPIVLWHGGLALYYASWVFGTRFDVSVQELVYYSFPKKGKVPIHGFIMVLLLVVAGAILLWTERYIGLPEVMEKFHIQRFAIALNVFIVVDHLAWRYLIELLKNVVCTSQNIYRQKGNYFALEALNIVSYQIQGNWKWWRLTGTMPIVILINAFAFSDTIHSYLTTTTMSLLPPFSNQDANAFVSGALLLCFVLVAEIWHWVIRIKTKVSLDFFDKVSDEYKLVPAKNP